MSNILVTGGAGFVGSHLCERLVSLGHKVTSLDNYFTGSSDNHVSDVTYINGSTEDILSLLYGKTFEYVYHLGEYSRVEQSFDDMELVWNFNKVGTYEVLKYVKQCGAKLIYAGSSTKFAQVDVVSPYQWSKASNTDFVNQFCSWHSIDYAITYFYNVYGKREIKDGKYSTLIAKYKTFMKQNKKLTIVLPGIQQRNFTHIDDIIDALILVGFNGHGDEYGIGNPTAYTIQEVAEMFGGEIEYLPERKGNRLSAEVKSEKTMALGWKPQRELAKYIESLKQNAWSE